MPWWLETDWIQRLLSNVFQSLSSLGPWAPVFLGGKCTLVPLRAASAWFLAHHPQCLHGLQRTNGPEAAALFSLLDGNRFSGLADLPSCACGLLVLPRSRRSRPSRPQKEGGPGCVGRSPALPIHTEGHDVISLAQRPLRLASACITFLPLSPPSFLHSQGQGHLTDPSKGTGLRIPPAPHSQASAPTL